MKSKTHDGFRCCLLKDPLSSPRDVWESLCIHQTRVSELSWDASGKHHSCPREPVMIQIPLFNLSTILWASCPKQRVFSKTGPWRVSVGKGEYGKNTWRKALWNAGNQEQQIWSSNAGSSIYVCAYVRICGSSVHRSLQQNTRVGCHVLLQGIFPTQGRNPDLPHCGQILYQLSHMGSPRILEVGRPSLLQGLLLTQESN